MKNIVTTVIFVLIPIVIGLPFSLAYHDEVYFEVSMVVFGLIWFLILVARINRHDRENKIRTGSFRNDKKSLEYYEYMTMQKMLFIAGIVCLAISYISFLISEYAL